MTRVVFYDDARIFGGHQVSGSVAARYVAAAGFETFYAYPRSNARLHGHLERLNQYGVRLIALHMRPAKWQPFVAPLGIGARPVREMLESIRPDLVVAVQGSIVHSNRAVEQARRAGVPVVSFIPMGLHFAPHEWFQQFVADLLARYHYRRLDAFITTTESARRELKAEGARAPIYVAFFAPDMPPPPNAERNELRRSLGLSPSGFALAIVGRINFSQKGHDVLLRTLASGSPQLSDATLLVVGDGPDGPRLDRLVAELGLRDRVIRLGWRNDVERIYAAVDMVVIPSHFEGLPLVAFEAIHYGVPVVGSDVSGLPEILPPEWLAPPGDVDALAEAIIRVRHEPAALRLDPLRARIDGHLNVDAFGRAFVDIIRKLVW